MMSLEVTGAISSMIRAAGAMLSADSTSWLMLTASSSRTGVIGLCVAYGDIAGYHEKRRGSSALGRLHYRSPVVWAVELFMQTAASKVMKVRLIPATMNGARSP